MSENIVHANNTFFLTWVTSFVGFLLVIVFMIVGRKRTSVADQIPYVSALFLFTTSFLSCAAWCMLP